MRITVLLFVLLLLIESSTFAQKDKKKGNRLPERNADGEYPNPFLNKPFRPGVPRKMHLIIPMGKINLEFDIVYVLENDEDGMMYSRGGRYRAEFQKVIPTGPYKTLIPPEISMELTEKRIELTEKEVLSKTLKTKDLFYVFTVEDFNADGVPDFAFVGDPGFHGSPESYYIWLNLKGKLVYWHQLSDQPSYVHDEKKRIISVSTSVPNEPYLNSDYYQVTNDTTLIPIEYSRLEETLKDDKPLKRNIKKKQPSKPVAH
jgi:hypothetical protein